MAMTCRGCARDRSRARIVAAARATVSREDFLRFDRVFAMDRSNLRALQRFRPVDARAAALFLGDADLPDPYYGGADDFERVVALAREGVAALIDRLSRGNA